MKRFISAKFAGNILLLAMAALAGFHILVLFGFLPSENVWGGVAAESTLILWALEAIALLVTAIFACVIAAKTGYILIGKFNRTVAIGMWIVFALLALSTLGNLASNVAFENLVFAPLAFILTIFAFRLAIHKRIANQ